ncbi:MAG: branched-chain amino acid ABC transporter permease [Ignisphaera sp.]|uniref:Branched-chain amino acid ABC transporter permease n=1 Tax=Ignisphaera aggregans TaxID=334771 RepID=A0A7C4JKA7_9CREN
MLIDSMLIVKAIVYSISIALGATGVTIIYNATKTFNFAHSSMVGWGVYVVFAFFFLFKGLPQIYFPIAFIFSGLLGVATYFTVNRRLIMAKASDINLMMSTLGVDLILFAFLNIFADYLLYAHKISIAKNFVLETWDPYLSIFGVSVRLTWVIAPIVFVMIFLFIHFMFSKTRIGVAMRATIENPALAQIQGINPDVVYLTSWFLGGGLAGLSGGILAMTFTGRPSIGMEVVVTFFAGAIVGGLETVYGGFLGGFLVGLSEYILPAMLAPTVGSWINSYKMIIPLSIMVITLLIRPSGLGIMIKRRVRI